MSSAALSPDGVLRCPDCQILLEPSPAAFGWTCRCGYLCTWWDVAAACRQRELATSREFVPDWAEPLAPRPRWI
jgi:hypothetical protein